MSRFRVAHTTSKTLPLSKISASVANLILVEYSRLGSLIVGIDGPDCSGKSTLCRSLVTKLKQQLRIIPIHLDDYLNPPERRTRLGEFSVEGFLNDFFDYEALIKSALEPFASFSRERRPLADIMLVEGLFLFRRELVNYFDLRLRLEINEELLLRRALARDVGQLGSEPWVRRHYIEQCIPAQKCYRETTPLRELSDVIINVATEDS